MVLAAHVFVFFCAWQAPIRFGKASIGMSFQCMEWFLGQADQTRCGLRNQPDMGEAPLRRKGAVDGFRPKKTGGCHEVREAHLRSPIQTAK